MNSKVFKTMIALLVLIPVSLIIYKVTFWDYSFEKVLSRTSYQVHFNYEIPDESDSIRLQASLPEADERQTIHAESNRSDGYNILILNGKNGRYASWKGVPQPNRRLSYSFEFIGYALQYQIDTGLSMPRAISEELLEYLEEGGMTESRKRDRAMLNYLGMPVDNLKKTLDELFSYASNLVQQPNARFVTLCREAGIPARFAGGIDLAADEPVFRNWAEISINDTWVPFDPENDHYARIPASYLKVSDGRHPMKGAHANVPFHEEIEVRQKTTINPELLSELPNQPFNAFSAWVAFEQAGIPLDILKVILLLPLGALIVALFRNVIGLTTFGIFLPALIAIASKETGIGWGILVFLLVISIVGLLHYPLEKSGLLSVPKMAVLLVSVVIVFIVISVAGVNIGMTSLAYVSLFPIVVVTISAERFAQTVIQDGYATAAKLTLQTIMVATATYLVMSSSTVESIFLTFPELFLVIIAVNLLLGKWIGLRLMEIMRFKRLAM